MDKFQHHLIQVKNAARHELEVTYQFKSTKKEHILQIPYWRPGRYEAGNFPRKYINLRVYDGEKELNTYKTSPNTWNIHCGSDKLITVKYAYFADDLSAGNTYCDEELFLINPVNSLVYIRGLQHDKGILEIEYPDSWSWASGLNVLKSEDRNVQFEYADVQEIMDSPVLFSSLLQTIEYEVQGIHFYAHIAGEDAPSIEEIERDYRLFTEAQVAAFGDFPVKSYHFLNILLPHKAYHGVEHENNTVIIFGPADTLSRRKEYLDFIGVSSHELYHTWNVKSLRPKEWTPYDFEGPGFSRMGYVAEGVTTYMGDYMLWHSGVFSDDEYLTELGIIVEKHLLNEGYKNLSLADSSIDTWVDGYGRTTPDRRVSIYNEGAMLAIICDIWLMKYSDHSLSDFMRLLYELKGGKKGYTEKEYWKLLKDMADAPWQTLYEDCVNGRNKLYAYFEEALTYVGLEIKQQPSAKSWERCWGFSILKKEDEMEVFYVKIGSSAERAGLVSGDEILKIDGQDPNAFLGLNRSEIQGAVELELKSGFRKKKVTVQADEKNGIPQYKVVLTSNTQNFKKWKNAARVNELDVNV